MNTSVQEVLNRQLGDADAAAAVVAAAPTTVTATAQADGTYLYQFTVLLPPNLLTASARQRRLEGGEGSDPFSAMLTDGTLTQRLLEAGVNGAQDLLDSGALGVAAAVVQPSGTPTASISTSGTPTRSPSTTRSPTGGVAVSLQLSGLPASALDSNGKLTASAAASLAAALNAGVAAKCPACTVAVTRVV